MIGRKEEKMSKLQIIIDSVAAAIGAALGFLFGEVNGLFWALIAFMALDYMPGVISEEINLVSPKVRLRMEVDFSKGADTVFFSYREPREGGKWRRVGKGHKLYFGLDHFARCRCGLAVFSTKRIGGSATFTNFEYKYEE